MQTFGAEILRRCYEVAKHGAELDENEFLLNCSQVRNIRILNAGQVSRVNLELKIMKILLSCEERRILALLCNVTSWRAGHKSG